MIAITGATGTIGSELIRLLSARAGAQESDVLALARRPEEGPKLEVGLSGDRFATRGRSPGPRPRFSSKWLAVCCWDDRVGGGMRHRSCIPLLDSDPATGATTSHGAKGDMERLKQYLEDCENKRRRMRNRPSNEVLEELRALLDHFEEQFEDSRSRRNRKGEAAR